MAVVIKRCDSVSVLARQVSPADRDKREFSIKARTVDLLIAHRQVRIVDGLTRVDVASPEENYSDGKDGDCGCEEAAHCRSVGGVFFGRNGTDVLCNWPATKVVLMGRDWSRRGRKGNSYMIRFFHHVSRVANPDSSARNLLHVRRIGQHCVPTNVVQIGFYR